MAKGKGKGKGKGKDSKKGGDDDLGPLAAKAFQKGFPAACAAYGVEPLPLALDTGEGTSAFLRLAVHPAVCGAAGNCSPLHVRALSEALANYTFLQSISFWGVGVRDEGMSALAALLMTNRSITSCEVSDCAIGVAGCKVLGEALERNGILAKLRLDHNTAIGSEGVAVLGEGIRASCGLQEISLSYCGLEGEDGAAALARVMRAPALQRLELRGNRFENGGVIALLSALRTSAVQQIDLTDTGFGNEPEVHAAFEACFEDSACGAYILRGNPLGDTTAYRWLQMARRLPNLIELNVSDQLDPVLFKQIGDVTAANKKEWLKMMKRKKGKGT